MTDVFSTSKRSEVMSRIRGRDTRPELAIQSMVHGMGYRFRLHDKRLPGRPDLVLPRLQTVIFVHGCFWHRHSGCRYTTTPATRRDFWQAKFDANVARDKRTTAALRRLGWSVLTVWECQLKKDPQKVADRLGRLLAARDC